MPYIFNNSQGFSYLPDIPWSKTLQNPGGALNKQVHIDVRAKATHQQPLGILKVLEGA